MTKKILPLLAAFSAALFFNACGDDSSAGSECLDGTCLMGGLAEDSSSSLASSSSVASSSSIVSSSSVESSSSTDVSSSSVTESSSSEVVEKTVYVFGSDYAAGDLNVVKDGALSPIDLELDQDSKLVAENGSLFILSRSGKGSVSLFDTKTNKVAWQVSADDGNPYDLVMADKNSAWVAMYNTPEIRLINTATGATVKSIDTKNLISIEGAVTPNAADLEVSGDTLFVVFQRNLYDAATWSTIFSEGLLAMYKLSDGALLDTVQLATLNPMSVKVVKGSVYVGTQGDYTTGEGAIEKIDLAKKSSSVFVSKEKLGGGVNSMVVDYASAKAFVAVYKAYGDVPVVEVDLATGTVKVIAGVADAEGSLAYDSAKGLLYVGDRGVMNYETYKSTDYKVYAYDGTKLTAIENGSALPPYSIALF